MIKVRAETPDSKMSVDELLPGSKDGSCAEEMRKEKVWLCGSWWEWGRGALAAKENEDWERREEAS